MDTYPKSEKPLLAQVFDAVWGDPQMEQELFNLIEEVAEGRVTWQYVDDWIMIKAAEKLLRKAKQLGAMNCAPLIAFLQMYTGKEEKSLVPTVKALIVDVALSAQAAVRGQLTLEVSPFCSQEEIRHIALSRIGGVTWHYSGTIDGTEHVEDITQTGQVLG